MRKTNYEDIQRVNQYILLFVHPSKEWDDLKVATYDQALQTLESIRLIECVGQQGMRCSYRYVRPLDSQLDLCKKRLLNN